jgi:bacillolysin
MQRGRFVAAWTTLLILVALMPLAQARSAPPSVSIEVSAPQPALLDTLRRQTDDQVRISYHARTGKVRFIGTDAAHPISYPDAPSGAAPQADAARRFLAAYGSLFGLSDQARQLSVERERQADRGRDFVRFQQVHDGIPVFGAQLIVQLDAARNVRSASGEILPDITLPTTPAISADAAQRSALDAVAKEYGVAAPALTTSAPRLWVYNPALVGPESGPTRLVWRMDVTPLGLLPIRELVLIDARRGSVALHFNQIDTAKNRSTYTANNSTTLPGTLVCNESSPTCLGGDSHAVGAHTYAGATYDFYAANHGRDSIDNAGMTIRSSVHYSVSYDNAFWNGSQMVYGDAHGFPLADDVVAHELTHGVTERESSLFYYYQSGAINESLSDVWGEFVDLTDGVGNDSPSVRWLLGEDISGLGAIRNMQNPPAFGDPDKITSPNYYTGSADAGLGVGDNGGVHTNSGVNNKAAYLMTDGGTFNGQTVAGLGITKVAKIYYEAQTNLLGPGSDYADLYDLLYQACLNLVGTAGIVSGDCQQVRNATNAVEMNQQPVAGYNTEATLCPASQSASTLFFDDLEGGTGNWSLGAFSGTSRWQYDSPYGPYSHSGSHFLYADDFPDAISDSYASMNVSVAVPANGYLHFAQAYGFENPNYDGGVLEYSTNGGTSWSDAGNMFEVNGYSGTIAASFGNPLAGRSGFVGDSHGYISSRLSLASLAGQSVRFRWRMATDSSVFDQGWWLDDVRIYTCSGSAATSTATPVTPTNTPTGTATRTATSTATPVTPTNTPTGTATSPPATSTPTSTPTNTPAAASPTATSTPATNLLANPGFELDANNDSRPDSWSSNSHFTRSNALAHGGTYAGRHFATDNSGYTISQAISSLTAGATYNVASWVNIPSTSDAFTLQLQVRWRNSSNSTISTITIKTYGGPTSGWDQTTVGLVAPAGTTNAQVRMVVSSLNATLYVDDFAFQLASSPGPTSTAIPTNTATPTRTRTPTRTPTSTRTPTGPTSTPAGPTATPSATPGSGNTFSFDPVADTYVDQASPTGSFGGATKLAVVGGSSAKQAFIRFSVAGLPAGAVVSSAKLRLHVTNDSTSGGIFNQISNTTWDENVTWNGRPAVDGPQLAALGAVALDTTVEVDVTAAIGGNGTYSFAISAPGGNTNSLAYASREASTAGTRPQLVITTQSSAQAQTRFVDLWAWLRSWV